VLAVLHPGAMMATRRLRQRKDGSTYAAVPCTLNGKQTSSSFNDHAEAVRFAEQHEEWIESRRDFGGDVLNRSRVAVTTPTGPQPATTPALTA